MSNTNAEPQPGPSTDETTRRPAHPKWLSGWVGWVVAFYAIFWISDHAGCQWTNPDTKASTNGRSTAEPGTRRVGPLGAVVGYDNYGRPTRLPPGTAVQATGSTYTDPMGGPKTIYVVEEGAFRGTQVPLGEHELEPQ